MTDFHDYQDTVLLRDGGSSVIRAIRPDDKERLLHLFERLSPESVYFRFFRSRRRLADDELRQYTEVDFKKAAALVATLRENGEEQIIGVGRYAWLGNEAEKGGRAEVAFTVADAHQGRGIGTALFERLLSMARANGIVELEAEVLGENNRMLDMFAHSGFKIQRSFESGVFHFSFPTEETEEFLKASHQRERQAAAQSLRAILNPRSVALIGASRQPGSIGAAILSNLRRDGFRGPIYPINPHAGEIAGLKAFPRIGSVGAPVDLAIIAVPAAAVEGVISECAAAGVRGVVVITAGFAESARDGREAEQRLVHLVRSSGMRMVGPNCMGVINTDPDVSLNATFAPARPLAGNIGMSSQSGALGIAILDRLQRLNLGLSTFVSVGNKADVSGNDLLAYWAQDPRTQVIVLYLESFGNPRKFARVAPEVARRKPIVAVKSGRSAAGSRAASSHSAALASLDVAVDALFEQAGVIRTATLEELFDVAALLATQPIPTGPRVGVVTNAGGPGILLADACEAGGLKLPQLSEASRQALSSFLPPQAGLSNPIDMIASATGPQYEKAIEVVGNDPEIDAVVVICIPILEIGIDDIARAIAAGAARVPDSKPVLTVFLSARGAPPILASGTRGRIPSFEFPENAALALAAAERYGRWRVRPRGDIFEFPPFTRLAIRAVVDRVLAGASGPVWVDIADFETILRAAGIEFAAGEKTSIDRAAETAERLGYPLVAKAIAPNLIHKSDVGGVALDLKSAGEVEAAVARMAARIRDAGSQLEGVFLQRQVAGGVEALVGVTTDPTFGPLMVCGMGGVLVELLKDVSFRLIPVSDLDAGDMLAALRSRPLLEGYRGSPPADKKALVDAIRRISALADIVPELLELDLNPIKVLQEGAIAVDGRMRLAPASQEPRSSGASKRPGAAEPG